MDRSPQHITTDKQTSEIQVTQPVGHVICEPPVFVPSIHEGVHLDSELCLQSQHSAPNIEQCLNHSRDRFTPKIQRIITEIHLEQKEPIAEGRAFQDLS